MYFIITYQFCEIIAGKNCAVSPLNIHIFYHAKQQRKKTRKRSLRSKTVMGIWLGIEPWTGEHRVALLGGGPITRVRTVIRVLESEQLTANEIASVRATPRDEDVEGNEGPRHWGRWL